MPSAAAAAEVLDRRLAQRVEGWGGDASLAHQELGQGLVRRSACTPPAPSRCRADPIASSSALDRAVLPVAPVQRDERGIDLRRLQLGHQLTADIDCHHLMAEAGEAVLDLGA